MKPIIDSHLDLAWNALSMNRDLAAPLSEIRLGEAGMDDHPSRGNATVSLAEMRRGAVVLCLGSLLVHANGTARPHLRAQLDYATQEIACAAAEGQLAYYRAMARRGDVRIIETAAALEDHWASCSRLEAPRPLGVIVSMEGADAILDAEQVQQWWLKGMRVAGLAHYGQGVYAGGTGTSAPLAEAARPLLREFQRLGIILDVTHLTDTGLAQALDQFAGAVLASHHNCRALVPGGRQLSDGQIRALIERDAVIGVALDNWMLCPGWQRGRSDRSQVTLDSVADHIDHICRLAGNCRHAAIGSDLDGCYGREQCPADLDTIADIQKLAGILAARGYGDADIASVFHGNWLRLLRRALPGAAEPEPQ